MTMRISLSAAVIVASSVYYKGPENNYSAQQHDYHSYQALVERLNLILAKKTESLSAKGEKKEEQEKRLWLVMLTELMFLSASGKPRLQVHLWCVIAFPCSRLFIISNNLPVLMVFLS